MPSEAAKSVGKAAADSAVNPRHNLELIGALAIGTIGGEAEQVQQILAGLVAAGIPEEWIMLGGLGLIIAARLMSYLKRRKET